MREKGLAVTDGFHWPERPDGPSTPGMGRGSDSGAPGDDPPAAREAGGSPLDYSEFVRGRVEVALAGEFEVLDLLGQGGAALVFRARRRSDGRIVALKVLREDQTKDPETLARFEREAELAVRLRHPNIVETLGVVDVPPNGRALVLECMGRGNLTDLLAITGRIPVPRAVAILKDAASALDFAHSKGVIHRDVKPDNIFLDEGGQAKLGDFGIARQVGTQTLNLHGMAIGSTHYMSPEQIEGPDTTARSDLYSLGCVGWQLLAGQAPWAWEPTLQSIIRRQLVDSLPPLRQYRTDVPDHVLRVLEACLQKSPDLRPSSARAVIDALEGRAPVESVSAGFDRSILAAATRRFNPAELRGKATSGAAAVGSSARQTVSRGGGSGWLSGRLGSLSGSQAVIASIALVAGLALVVAGSALAVGSRDGGPSNPSTAPAPQPAQAGPSAPRGGGDGSSGAGVGAVVLPSVPDVLPPSGLGELDPPMVDSRPDPVEQTETPDPPPQVAPVEPSPPPPQPETWPESRVRQAVEDLMAEGRYSDAAGVVQLRSTGGARTQLLSEVSRVCRAEQEVMQSRGLPAPNCP